MRKTTISLICLGILAFGLLIPAEGLAGTVGNTGGVNTLRGRGMFSLRENHDVSLEAGFDLDVVLDRDLKAGDVKNARFETGEWGMLRLGYRVFDRLEPYARLGWAHLKAGWTDSLSGKNVEMTSQSGFAWGLGMKALVYEFATPNIKIVADASYRSAALDAEKGYFNGAKLGINSDASVFVVREWQAALLAVTEIDFGPLLDYVDAIRPHKFFPYAGIVFSEVSGRLRLVDDVGNVYHPDDFGSDKNLGVVLGCDLAIQDYVSLNLEGRLIDETAVSGGLAMLF